MSRLFALALLFAASATPAQSFLWPWQYVRHFRHHHVGMHHYHRRDEINTQVFGAPSPSKVRTPNCDEIRAAAARLGPDALELSMSTLSEKRRRTLIRDCGVSSP